MSSAGRAALSLRTSSSRKPTSSMTLRASGGIDVRPSVATIVASDQRRKSARVDVGHAEQLADHEHRQRRGQHVDQVDDLAPRDRVEQRDGERPDGVLHPRPPPGGVNSRFEDAAPLVVPRRVEVQDRALDAAAFAQRVVDQHAAAGAEPGRVAADLADVVVTGDRP